MHLPKSTTNSSEYSLVIQQLVQENISLKDRMRVAEDRILALETTVSLLIAPLQVKPPQPQRPDSETITRPSAPVKSPFSGLKHLKCKHTPLPTPKNVPSPELKFSDIVCKEPQALDQINPLFCSHNIWSVLEPGDEALVPKTYAPMTLSNQLLSMIWKKQLPPQRTHLLKMITSLF